jgi:hypothetical protein
LQRQLGEAGRNISRKSIGAGHHARNHQDASGQKSEDSEAAKHVDAVRD